MANDPQHHERDGGGTGRLRAHLASGQSLAVGNFKALDSGVVLTADEGRDDVVGFVPHDQLTYILPADVAVEDEEEPEADPLTRIPGVGRTYARRLREAGFGSVAAVADADPESVVDATGARRKEVDRWRERAADIVTEGTIAGERDGDDGENGTR